jgi:hypothetical protein
LTRSDVALDEQQDAARIRREMERDVLAAGAAVAAE